ncbi:MAG: hypothetical protein IT449_12830 [Phycisphaerales bacterium]|nr:hypothetical protein [Phycisphaerales bacterium]
MRERFQSPYPMVFVQYHLQGGARRFATIAVGYVLVCVLALLGYRRAAALDSWRIVALHALRTLAYAQGVICVLVGSNMVYRALFRDHQSRMSESHRLSPMSDISMVLGYMFGGPLQALLLYGINLLVGTLLASIAQSPVKIFLGGNALLLSCAMTVWSLAVFWGVGNNKPVSPVGPLIGLLFAGNVLLLFLPGAALLFGIYAGSLALWIMSGGSSPGTEAVYLIAVSNLLFTWFWLRAACARYRRPELPALNGLRGSVLLLMWLIASTIGTVVYQRVSQIKQFEFMGEIATAQTHWLVSLCVGLLLALLPISSAATLRHISSMGTKLRGWPDRLPDIALGIALPLLICGITAVLGRPIWKPLVQDSMLTHGAGTTFVTEAWSIWLKTGLACTMACLTFLAMARVCAAREKTARGLSIFILCVMWLGLPALDLAYAGYQAATTREPLVFSGLFGCSPLGTLVLTWTAQKTPTLAGLVFQTAACAVAVAVASLMGRSRRAAA